MAVKYDIKEQSDELEETLTESWTLFTQYLALQNIDGVDEKSAGSAGGGDLRQRKLSKRSHLLVKISITYKTLSLNLRTDESYTLSISTRVQQDLPRDEVLVFVKAKTFYGARHALETLAQMITYDPIENCYRVPFVASVEDSPAFPYRGILIDTGRNYFSVDSIKRVIDGMSYNKLNVLHWHMNEQQSFPFVSERVPELTQYGAYSSRYIN